MTSTDHGALTIRKYREGDEHRILETFNTVFRQECGPDFVARGLDFWRWQFERNPAGTQILLAVAEDGTVASQYTAIPQLADTVHGQQRWVHVVDSMTHPDYRQGLKREGLFATLGRMFTADYDEHGNEMGYGFPVRMAERIGRRLLDYSLLRTVEYWLRAPDAALPSAPADVRLEHNANFPVTTDALWHDSLPSTPCAVRKDQRYLQWRYVDHPEQREYVRITAWRGASLTGVMVLRPRHELVPDACTITELVCRDDDEGTARALLREACRIAALHQRTLMAVFADHDPRARWMRDVGAELTPSGNWLERRMTVRVTGPRSSFDELAHNWRYTLGDTDLC